MNRDRTPPRLNGPSTDPYPSPCGRVVEWIFIAFWVVALMAALLIAGGL